MRDEIVQTAAEAAAANISRLESGGPEEFGVDKLLTLIVGKDTHSLSNPYEIIREPKKRGRLARSEETSQKDKPRH